MSHASGAIRSGEVDALRAFAMLSVITLHAHIFPAGWIGVWLFYVVSGYVVTLSVLERREDFGGLPAFGAFMRRRAARILPVYYGYVAFGLLFAALVGFRQNALSLSGLLLFFDNALMITGSGRVNGWPSGHLWTLSVEMQFYLLYGLALFLLPRKAVRTLLLALLVLCPLARFATGDWLLASGWRPLDAAFFVYAAPGLHFDIFAMGALLAFAGEAGRLARIARPLALTGFAALALYSLAYVALNHFARGAVGTAAIRNVISGILIGQHREVWLYSAIGLAMTGIVALAASGDRLVRPLLGLRPLQWIGGVSYGGYVFHQVGLIGATSLLTAFGLKVRHGGFGPHLLQFIIGVACTLLIAWLSFRWFERPARRWFQSDTRRRVEMPLASPGLEAR